MVSRESQVHTWSVIDRSRIVVLVDPSGSRTATESAPRTPAEADALNSQRPTSDSGGVRGPAVGSGFQGSARWQGLGDRHPGLSPAGQPEAIRLERYRWPPQLELHEVRGMRPRRGVLLVLHHRVD